MTGSGANSVVVGGGVVGAAAACALARRGERVTLVERWQPGHRRGSSHGDGRIFRFTYPRAIYIAMARLAGDGWRRLEAASGERLLVVCGNWDGGPAGGRELAELAAALDAAGLACERLSAAESAERFPRLTLPAASEALFQPDGGVLRADRAWRALWRQAVAAGAETMTGATVAGLDAGEGGVELVLDDGRRLRARRLVLAAGAWSGPLLARLGVAPPLEVTQEVVAYFPPQGGLDHGPGALPTFIDHHDGRCLYGLPRLAVGGVKVGWHHGGGQPLADPDRRPAADPASVDVLRSFVARRLPGLAPEPVAVETCLYTNTPDHDFLVDRHPTLPHVAFAAGLSGHGFKFAPLLGDALADLVLDEEPPIALEPFALRRFATNPTLS